MKKKILLILCIILCIGIPGAGWFIYTSTKEAPDKDRTAEESSDDSTLSGTESDWWLTLDTSGFPYDETTQAYTTDCALNLSCMLNPDKKTDFLSCSVINEYGDTIFYYEPTVSDSVTLHGVGLYVGYNEVKFICKNEDDEYETTYAFLNSSTENVGTCDIDSSDNDQDSINHYTESVYGTNPDLADTDGDGMDDYTEIYVLHTNPLSADSNDNGIDDFDEDTDEDGIINTDEILTYQTNPFAPDTDNDSLNDYDELFTYYTNPLQADTDGDGLHDGQEILNQYNPLQANATFEMTKSETSNGITTEASIHTTGADVQSFTISVSEDVRFGQDLPGYLSDAFSFHVDSGQPGTVTLSFTLQEDWIQNENISPAICCFDEQRQCFYALDTTITGGVATAQTTLVSTYMLLDLNTMYQPATSFPDLTVWDIPSAEVDSNNDGISDRDTYLLCRGAILTGMGQKVFGDATYEEIQANNDYDNDGLLNGEEVSLNYLDTVPSDAISYNGHFYKVYDIGEYWDTARFKAESMGGYLCAVTSSEEQEFVKNLLPDDGMGLYWIGSSLTESGWAWVSGEPFEYTHWGDSEPNNMNAVEAFAQMYAKPFKKKVKGDWNDASNEGAQYSDNFYVIGNTGYVVEWNSNNPYVRYALLHSSPTSADTDGDGITDSQDTAAFIRGLKDGVLAKLMLIAHNDGRITKGHSFLVLHSYVDDLTIDLSNFYRGVDVSPAGTYHENLYPSSYTLMSGTDIALGSAGNASLDDIGNTNDSLLAIEGIWFRAGLWYNLGQFTRNYTQTTKRGLLTTNKC